jgi:hypothetical protein
MRLAYRLPDRRLNRLRALVARLRRRCYGDPHQCGLLHAHPGECVWFTPGQYLDTWPPLLRALDPCGWREPCPGCGRRVNSIGCEGELWWLRGPELSSAFSEQRPGAQLERLWRFGPCGCERREIVAADQAR